MKLIDKDALVAEIENIFDKDSYPEELEYFCGYRDGNNGALYALKDKLKNLEVKDPYEQTIQYPSIKDGIKAHAETYSFNIESLLFNQLTKEQQALWRKEIEQACISGGEVGVELARDTRYKENAEVKEADLEKEMDKEWNKCEPIDEGMGLEIASIEHEQFDNIAKHFFELGLKAQKK